MQCYTPSRKQDFQVAVEVMVEIEFSIKLLMNKYLNNYKSIIIPAFRCAPGVNPVEWRWKQPSRLQHAPNLT